MKMVRTSPCGTVSAATIPGKTGLLLLALFLSAFSFSAFSQSPGRTTVTGAVRDSAGVGIPGVTITERGTTNATSTSAGGTFSIGVAGSNSVLVFTSVGYGQQEVRVGSQSSVGVTLRSASGDLGEVVVIGYGTRKKESLTGAISTVTSKELDRVHAGATASAGLAGKIPGVSFRMSDGRPGASATIQIRNMGDPLFVIDGIQQDAGQFNNIAPNDIESITVLKDGSAAIYGARAANGVVLVTTKRGQSSAPSVNLEAFYGLQNWTRFPDGTGSSYDYWRYRAEAEMNNVNPSTTITPAELEKYRIGTEYGYQSFDWKDFIIQPNSPLVSVNANVRGGSEAVKYYLSGTNLHQNSVTGREYRFDRSNIQSNLDARVNKRIRVGVQINGRVETRQNPGIPGEDYFLPRFAILKNRPFERPYANDNPEYLNTIAQNDANWAYNNYKYGGKFVSEWRVLQTNLEGEYQIPFLEGLSVRGLYSYYIADNLMNNQEYTYKTYTYRPATQTYEHTGGSINPFRAREQIKQINKTSQIQLSYNKTFGQHTVNATLVNERISQQRRRNFTRSLPPSNVLPLLYFNTLVVYDDEENREARVGYAARASYSYANKYFVDVFGRRDASQIFPPDQRVGYFPGASVGWRLTRERFASPLFRGVLSDLKLRASYGKLGEDRGLIGNFAYLPGYTFGNNGVSIINGTAVIVSRDRGLPITDFSWLTAISTNIGADFGFFNNKLTGTFEVFHRKRSGLAAARYDLLLPSEIGYGLPSENLESDVIFGQEGSLAYTGKAGAVNFNVGANLSYARSKWAETYKEVFYNSLDKYRSSRLNRYRRIDWGYEVIGRFQTQEEINNYPVMMDTETGRAENAQGNRTLLPGDLIYKDVDGDGKITTLDQRPIGYGNAQPNINFGFTMGLNWKGFDFAADFSGGAGYTYFQNHEIRHPFQNNGNFNPLFEDRWHRQDIYDVNSAWIPGKYPALRFNQGNHSNNNRTSTFWAHNVKYLRARTIQLAYSIPTALLNRVNIKRARVYVNAFNLFSIDNLRPFGIDPEVAADNGLDFPQMKNVNFGVNLSF